MDNHFSDETLLSHLDGELSSRAKKKVREHLDACWSCRARQRELEETIQAVSTAQDRLSPSPYWVIETEQKIAALGDSIDRQDRRSTPRTVFGQWRMAFACALSIVVLGLAVFRLLVRQPATKMAASAAIQRITTLEAALAVQNVHQVFNIEEVDVRPKGPSRTGRLEVWSEGNSGRFASRWIDSKGVLKHGLWRPGTDIDYIYSSSGRPAKIKKSLSVNAEDIVLPGLSVSSGQQPDLDQLEQFLMRWLERRQWKPVAFLPNLSVWASRGRVLELERLSAKTVQLTGTEERDGVEVYFVAEVEEGEFWPHLQKIGIATPERRMEIRLVSESIERAAHFTPAVFQPDRTVAFVQVARREPSANRESALTAPRLELPPEAPRLSPDSAALTGRIEAYHLLHLAGACEGASVRISQEADGVRVSAHEPSGGNIERVYVASAATLSDLTEALANLRGLTRSPAQPSTREAAEALRHAAVLDGLAQSFEESELIGAPRSSVQMLSQMFEEHVVGLRNALAQSSNPPEMARRFPRLTAQELNPHASDWRSSARLLLKEANEFASTDAADLPALENRRLRLHARMEELAGLYRRHSEGRAFSAGRWRK